MSGCMNISQLTIAVIMFLPDLVIVWISDSHLRASTSIHLNMSSIFIQIYNFSLSCKDRLFKIYLSQEGKNWHVFWVYAVTHVKCDNSEVKCLF